MHGLYGGIYIVKSGMIFVQPWFCTNDFALNHLQTAYKMCNVEIVVDGN